MAGLKLKPAFQNIYQGFSSAKWGLGMISSINNYLKKTINEYDLFDYKYDNTYLQENNIFVNGKIETIMEDYYDDDGYDDEYGYYSYYGYNYNDYENDYENDNYYEYEDYNTKITKNRTRRVFNTTNDKLKRQNIRKSIHTHYGSLEIGSPKRSP